MSPMDAAGEERLRQLRAHIHKTFGPDGRGRRAKRTLEMPTEAPKPAKTPRTKLRQRIEQASQLSADQIFCQQFGSREELMKTEFDLARPAGHPVSKVYRRYAAGAAPSAAVSSLSIKTAGGPTTHYFSSSSTSSFTSSLPAPSTAKLSHLTRHLTRSTRIKSPRKAAIKRGRAGESSAEKTLVLRKPRLGGVSGQNLDYTITTGSHFGAQTAAPLTFDARKPLVTSGDDVPNVSTSFLSRTSPSKFQFPSNATRLFSQRHAPLR
ncbi:hypothetical protein KXD40_003915 [Peronospora effusa]|uniref:Uncharacterized protein n=1 Tax=Peronospora effusa TaxID=542832 RepID=A0A3R7XUL4_9STRA|nr:hypothetical protein DD237_000265 [Peronospora effusa]UIZ23209.1 hypothetical protein KXD40_003915 [Peronospora effusa]CAI5703111.1 unnamed protein product [Peronospora effusa]